MNRRARSRLAEIGIRCLSRALQESSRSLDSVPGLRSKDSQELPMIYLHPGQLAVSSESGVLTTVLGSCVSICLWDRVRRVGGMNHFLLPFRAGEAQASTRFGNVATYRLLSELAALGCEREDLRAKVFGGACVLEAFRHEEHNLGQQNVELARRLLKEADIPVIAEDVGGRRGRRLIFNTDDGGVLSRLL